MLCGAKIQICIALINPPLLLYTCGDCQFSAFRSILFTNFMYCVLETMPDKAAPLVVSHFPRVGIKSMSPKLVMFLSKRAILRQLVPHLGAGHYIMHIISFKAALYSKQKMHNHVWLA